MSVDKSVPTSNRDLEPPWSLYLWEWSEYLRHHTVYTTDGLTAIQVLHLQLKYHEEYAVFCAIERMKR